MNRTEQILLALSVITGLCAIFWGSLEELLLSSPWVQTCPYLTQPSGNQHHRFVRYKNGIVLTGNLDDPVVEEFVVDQQQGVFVLENVTDASMMMDIDLGGALVTPGLVDPHVHFLSGGLFLESLNVGHVRDRVGLAHEVEKAVQAKERGGWVVGYMYHGEFGHARWIDGVSPDTPVVIYRFDSHQMLVNSVALRLASIDASTPEPSGGEIVRDENGRPTGVLCDAAMSLVTRVIPKVTEADLMRAFERAQQYAFSKGVTHVHDMGRVGFVDGEYAAFEDVQNIYREVVKSGELKIRMNAFVSLNALPAILDMVNALGRREDRLSFGSVKGFYDGSLSSRTALMYEPYKDDGSRGVRAVNVSDFVALVSMAKNAGVAVATHAIGSRAVDEVIDVYEKFGGNGLRIEHAQHVSGIESIKKLAKLGIGVTPNPLHWVGDRDIIPTRLHEKDSMYSYPLKEFVRYGVNVGLASDWPVVDMDPMETLEAAIDSRNPYALSFSEALWSITRGAALLGDPNARFGAIQDGMFADFVIHASTADVQKAVYATLDIPNDSHVSSERLKDAIARRQAVEKTFVQGQCVYGCS